MDDIKLSKINREEALRYMAAQGDVPQGVLAELTESCEKALLDAAVPAYTYRVFKIAGNNGEKVTLTDCGLVLTGRDISLLLKDCTDAVIMCATIGAKVDALIRTYQAESMAMALITDSLASAAVEQVCDKFDRLLKLKYPDKFLTRRFSPGYGDLPLAVQGELLDTINAGRLAGVCLNASGMMTPIKSVTAVCGISPSELPAQKTGCVCCAARENCIFRKRGTHCEF